MAWTFIANSENQATLADALQLAADNFDARKSEMYGKIDSMGDHWKGEDYDMFNSSAHNYDNALSDFSDSIRMYSKQFLTISSATEQLAAELVSIIMNMTGSGGAAGGGGVAGGVGAAIGAVAGAVAAGAAAAGAAVAGAGAAAGAAAGNRNWYQKIGDRYVSDWNDFTGDVSRAWGNADGLISGAHALGVTVAETGLMVNDMIINTAQAGVDTVKTGVNWLFDAGDGRAATEGYWNTIGEDYAENWDFSTVDNFAEGAGVVITGTVRTVVDAGQTVVNAVCDAGNAVGDAVSWVGDKITDGLSWLGGKIFG